MAKSHLNYVVFLGLTGYYHKFVQNYGIIAQPLTNLLKRGKFRWHQEAKTAFDALKHAMKTTPTLAMPIYAKEMLTIVQAIQVWHSFLLGKKFFIATDLKSLKYFLNQ